MYGTGTWDLDGEGQGKGPKEPVLSLDGNSEFVELENIEGPFSKSFCTDEVKGQDGNEHQYTSSHCKKEEFNGRIDPPLRITPDTDEKVHRDKHHLPEDIEEDEIQGTKAPIIPVSRKRKRS